MSSTTTLLIVNLFTTQEFQESHAIAKDHSRILQWCECTCRYTHALGRAAPRHQHNRCFHCSIIQTRVCRVLRHSWTAIHGSIPSSNNLPIIADNSEHVSQIGWSSLAGISQTAIYMLHTGPAHHVLLSILYVQIARTYKSSSHWRAQPTAKIGTVGQETTQWHSNLTDEIFVATYIVAPSL